MRRYTHERLVRRNTLLGKVLSFGGIGILVVALIVSLTRPTAIGLVLPVSLIGMVASQIGTIFLTRWNRRDRADLMIDEALKGLDGRFALFHYLLGTPHVLIGPAGAVALVPRSEVGLIEHADDRWWITRYRRGQPDGKRRELVGLEQEAESAARALERRLERAIPEHAEGRVTPVAVFLAENTRLEAEGSSPAAVHVKKLKEFVRKMPRHPGPSEADVDRMAERFPPPLAGRRPS
ncbi:MAG TPA: hypothetical protein VFI11_08640 [Anaerolineales bacterium]|nr:hypothetical protein [Anaerolineales bacterium]